MARVYKGEQTPVFFGSAMTNFGVQLFLDAFMDIGAPPLARALDVRALWKASAAQPAAQSPAAQSPAAQSPAVQPAAQAGERSERRGRRGRRGVRVRGDRR